MVTENTLDKTESPALSAVDVEKIAPTLGAKEMVAIFGITQATFHAHQRQGRFARFELKNPIGRKRYSGVLVRAYLRGGGEEPDRAQAVLRRPRAGVSAPWTRP